MAESFSWVNAKSRPSHAKAAHFMLAASPLEYAGVPGKLLGTDGNDPAPQMLGQLLWRLFKLAANPALQLDGISILRQAWHIPAACHSTV